MKEKLIRLVKEVIKNDEYLENTIWSPNNLAFISLDPFATYGTNYTSY